MGIRYEGKDALRESRNLHHQKGFRPSVGNGIPSPGEGSNGDMRFNSTIDGMKMFVKHQGQWLSFSPDLTTSEKIRLTHPSAVQTFQEISLDSSANLLFSDKDGTTNVTFQDDGQVGIGTNSPAYQLDVQVNKASNYMAKFLNDGNSSNRYGILIMAGADSPGSDGDCRWVAMADGDGTIYAHLRYKHSGTTAEIHNVSDERLKENIEDTSVDGLDAINSLNFREYNWIENSKRSQDKISIGLVAQEVTATGDKCNIASKFEDEMELKDGSKITDVQGIGYSGMLLYLAKAVQELSAKVTALENA